VLSFCFPPESALPSPPNIPPPFFSSFAGGFDSGFARVIGYSIKGRVSLRPSAMEIWSASARCPTTGPAAMLDTSSRRACSSAPNATV
jgi:hypothetical protein